MLTSTEQAYTRTVKLGTAEIPLDLGWVPINDCRLLLLMNATGKNNIEVLANGVPFMVIHPGESARWTPHPDASLTIRSPGGAARLTVVSIPK